MKLKTLLIELLLDKVKSLLEKISIITTERHELYDKTVRLQEEKNALNKALDKFESLKAAIDEYGKGTEVWIARDEVGVYLYSQEPFWNKKEEIYDSREGDSLVVDSEMGRVLNIKLKHKQCKRYVLSEVKDENI